MLLHYSQSGQEFKAHVFGRRGSAGKCDPPHVRRINLINQFTSLIKCVAIAILKKRISCDSLPGTSSPSFSGICSAPVLHQGTMPFGLSVSLKRT